MHEHMRVRVQCPLKESVGCPGAGVTVVCDWPDVGAVVDALKH